MFERLKNLWRKMNPPTQENSGVAEPVAIRAGWRKNRKYKSRRESDAAYRQRKAAAKEIAPLESVTREPEIISILPVPSVELPSSKQSVTVEQSHFPFSELRGLLRPGPHAKLIVEVKPAPIELPTPSESPKAAQTIEPTLADADWTPDWKQEARTDLPVRTPEEIARLLKFETPEQIAARIQNDLQRHLYARLRRGQAAPDVQSAIINGDAPVSGINYWGRRA